MKPILALALFLFPSVCMGVAAYLIERGHPCWGFVAVALAVLTLPRFERD